VNRSSRKDRCADPYRGKRSRLFLFRAVEKTSSSCRRWKRPTCLSDPPVLIEKIVARPDFENWIARYLEQIAGCVDRLLKTVALKPDAIDSVFLTGGSSFVPACGGFSRSASAATESEWATSSRPSRAASAARARRGRLIKRQRIFVSDETADYRARGAPLSAERMRRIIYTGRRIQRKCTTCCWS